MFFRYVRMRIYKKTTSLHVTNQALAGDGDICIFTSAIVVVVLYTLGQEKFLLVAVCHLTTRCRQILHTFKGPFQCVWSP